jgi:hypothetical protein
MKDYLIKEWTMRILALISLAALSVAGCVGLQPSETSTTVVPLEEVSLDITPAAEIVPKNEMSFLTALRKACIENGFFGIRYEGKDEYYDCSPRQ